MELNRLTAVSPLDGRYRKQIQHLDEYFSEYALMKYRVQVEIAYFLFLAEKKIFKLPTRLRPGLQKIGTNFGLHEAEMVKQIEAVTNHDVKAVEYYIKQEIEKLGGESVKEWVHFGLTSQDINNTAIPLSWKAFIENEYLPSLLNLTIQLEKRAATWNNLPMLARTHGQPATPTKMGKEISVFIERIRSQVHLLSFIPFSGKFGGATGNLNAHHVAFPQKDWIKLANEFVERHLGLQRQQFTTQIEHYDNLAAHLDNIKRINNIMIDLCRDLWAYVSMDYFKQKIKSGEVGSSAMPHKVNPIDFENAEGNLGLANAFLEHLSGKLPISRLQRDLTDSTVIRNLGVPMGHSLLAIKSIAKGLDKLVVNEPKLKEDLEMNWAVVAEAIQTILRREQYPNPYEVLKELTRGKGAIDKKTIEAFINGLNISSAVKRELKRITPHNYTGVF
jgi:adenylosuccinate lyase